MNSPPNIRGVAVPWFTAETYTLLLEISANPKDLPETYVDWLARVEPRFERHASDGVPVRRVLIDPDELLEWCQDNNRPVDAHARAGFAAYVMMRRERAH